MPYQERHEFQLANGCIVSVVIPEDVLVQQPPVNPDDMAKQVENALMAADLL